ncbi:hypothetical protein ACFPH6_04785 [Streptomyces xiangluensis]|uniref:Uncharacterized protein n=1 Tax=Streptomyces xiangluensis TaxID=2665720 RepID=A0ABV8YJ38_9ACTN
MTHPNGNSDLKGLLGIAAMSVTRNKDCYLSAYYRRASPPAADGSGPWSR